MENYTLGDMADRARAALAAYKDHLENMMAWYATRRSVRKKCKLPALALCGPSRCGKDLAAAYIAKNSDLVYAGSASQIFLPFITHMVYGEKALGESQVERERKVHTHRHEHTEFMIEACHALRGDDLGLLTRMCLAVGDMVTGLRGNFEFNRVTTDGTIDLAVWIHNSRVPADPTLEYGCEECDLMIPNCGSQAEFFAKLQKLLKQLQL